MKTMMIFFPLLWVLFALLILFSSTALWQRKEYRTDRFFVYLTEAFQWQDFLLKRPILTKKAMFILVTAAFLLSLFGGFLFSFFDDSLSPRVTLIAGAGILLIIPLTSLTIVCIDFLTRPLKYFTIIRARKKIATMSSLTVIGVTGSYGKTMTKDFVTTLLSEKYKTLKTPLHVNADFAIAQVILKSLKKDHEVFVVEMGAYKRGEIAAICQMVRPKIGVITGINEQHLALFGSMENTMQAKGELVDALPKDGVVIFNEGNGRARKIAAHFSGKKIGYGSRKEYAAQNLDGAVAVARVMGLSAQEVERGVRKIHLREGPGGKKGINGALIIDDSYSSNPTGFAVALDYLVRQKGKRKIVITPGIIELGAARARVHRALGQKIKMAGVDLIVSNASFAKLFGIHRWIASTNERKILSFLHERLTRDDVVLIEGRIPMFLQKGIFQG